MERLQDITGVNECYQIYVVDIKNNKRRFDGD